MLAHQYTLQNIVSFRFFNIAVYQIFYTYESINGIYVYTEMSVQLQTRYQTYQLTDKDIIMKLWNDS